MQDGEAIRRPDGIDHPLSLEPWAALFEWVTYDGVATWLSLENNTMASLLDSLMSQLGGDTMGGIAGMLGADQGATSTAVESALPAMVSALSNNASQAGGADALLGALGQHDGSILDSALGGAGGSLGGIDVADGGKILSHMFGGKQEAVGQNIAQSSGLDLGSVMKLLPMLAPLLMGMLGKMHQSQGLSASGLSSLLAEESSQAKQSNPGLGGLMSMLDLNKDGNVMDDVKGLAGKAMANKGLLSRLFSGLRKR